MDKTATDSQAAASGSVSRAPHAARAYGAGVKEALQRYGESDQDTIDQHPPKPEKSWLPTALAAGAAGLGMYGLMRRPSSVGRGGLSAVQPAAAEHGFYRTVPVYTKADLGKAPKVDNWFDSEQTLPWFQHHMTPHVNDDTGQFSPLNRLKFWATEGDHSIPVAGHAGKQWVPGAPGGRVDVHPDAVVTGRHEWHELAPGKSMADVIGGGRDLEGSRATQQALTSLSQAGKGVEANLLLQHAPDAIPQTEVGVARFSKDHGDRYKNVQHLKKSIDKHFGGEYYVKPNLGLQSGGAFPQENQDWGKVLSHYDAHMKANPEKARWINEHGGTDFDPDKAHYLKKHDLYEGHTLHSALADPSSVVLQRKIPGYGGEFRVHSHQGQVIPSMTSSRHGDAKALEDLLPFAYTDKHRDMHGMVQGALDRLPEEYRRGSYGFDVAKGAHPETGETTWHILEMNPTERANATLGGGSSGFLGTDVMPTVAHAQHRAVTGRHTQPVALAAGLAGAGVAGGIARKMTSPDDESDSDRAAREVF